MDPFTEKILARARERQKLLEGYNINDKTATPLRETNDRTSNILTTTVSEPNLNENKQPDPKLVSSDSNLTRQKHSFTSSLKENFLEGNISKNVSNSKTRVSSDLPGSPGSQSKTLNIQRDNFNMEIKLTSTENVRVEVEIEEHSDDNNSETSSVVSESGLREDAKNRLKRLGRLYAGGEDANISSPIHRTEGTFEVNDDTHESDHVSKNRSKAGLRRLADLAQTINQWEDDLSHPSYTKKPSSPRKTWKPPAPQPPEGPSSTKSSPTKPRKSKAPSPPVVKKHSGEISKSLNSPTKSNARTVDSPSKNYNATGNVEESSANKHCKGDGPNSDSEESSSKGQCNNGSPSKTRRTVDPTEENAEPVSTPTASKQLRWDDQVLSNLESQGFKRTTSSSRLVYSYTSQEKKFASSTEQQQERTSKTIQEESDTEEKDIDTRQETEHTKPKTSPIKTAQNHVAKSNAIANRAALFESKMPSPTKNTKDPALLSVSERKALFEKNKGAALVPKAAFGMSAPVKVDTTMKACESKFIGASKSKENVLKIAEKIDKLDHPSSPSKNQPKPATNAAKRSPKSKPAPRPTAPPLFENNHKNATIVAAVHQAGGIASTMAALLGSKTTISEEHIQNNIKEQRQKEMDMLLNRFQKSKEVSDNVIEEAPETDSEAEEDFNERTAMIKSKSAKIVKRDDGPSVIQTAPKSAEKRKSSEKKFSNSDCPKVVSVIEEVKRIKVSPPKAGRLYPNLSDIEATTTETETRTPSPDNNDSSYEDNRYDSDDANTSFGRDILQVVCQNQTPQKRAISEGSSSSGNNSYIIDELDEILEEMDDDCSINGPTPPKQGRQNNPQVKVVAQTSNSFNYKSYSSPKTQERSFQSPRKSQTPRKSIEPPVYVVEGGEEVPLTHTVSFYRKQQNQAQTPVRQISRQPVIEESPDNSSTECNEVEQKVRELQEEVHKQENIISQTSQALNLCSSTPEFSGSTEQVEAERVLLVATHRRLAALHELQRLNVEGTIRPQGKHAQHLPLEKGTLTISNIVLPMKKKYVTALAAAGGKGHHVVCLVKCGEQVVPTKLVSTVASSHKNPDMDLYVPGNVVLKNIYSDFTVTFEVYCLQAQEECLPHEVKYHINKKPTKGLSTPKKSKQESRLVRPIKESPGGPQAVRSSSFALMGYIVFSVTAVNKKTWSLNNTPPMSPLEGSVEMKISCELAVSVEHRGFLTMFEDVSGFGAWHRRWCLLKGYTLSYWKYPDDERKMAPIDTLDLKNCITKEVGPVSRDICARLHTILLERERIAYPQDKDTLVMVRKGDKTVIRHLLSADTKEERIEWCYKLNAALTALRMWGTKK